jgi:hypothetical protein
MYYPSPISQEYDEFGRRITQQDLPLMLPQETVAFPPTVPPATATPAPQAAPTPARVPTTATIQPAPITPAPLTSAETEAMRLYKSMPQYEPPSKLQRVLAGIAGGAEGYLSRSPTAGVRAAQEVLEAPRRSQMARWQERVAAIKPQLDIEQRLYERGLDASKLGIDVSKLGLEESRIESTIEAELARIAATQAGQEAKAEYQNNLLEIRRLEAEGRLGALEARAQEAKKLNEYRQKLLELRKKEVEQTGAYRSRMAAVAESRAKQAGKEKTMPVTPEQQRTVESLAAWDVLRDLELQKQLPAGTVITDYLQPVTNAEKQVIEYRLRPFGVKTKDMVGTMDPNIYNLIKLRLEDAKRRRLGLTRQGQPQLFEDVDEPREKEVP